MVEQKQNKADFKILVTTAPLVLERNSYFMSIQEIQQENGSFSTHYVLKKQSINADGSPIGYSKQIFIPVVDIQKVIKALQGFVDEQTK